MSINYIKAGKMYYLFFTYDGLTIFARIFYEFLDKNYMQTLYIYNSIFENLMDLNSTINSIDDNSNIFSYIFGGIISIMGIVAAILLFLVDSKLARASLILDDVVVKYMENKLDYRMAKIALAIYFRQWENVKFNSFFRFLLVLFFSVSSLLVIIYLYILCNIYIHFRNQIFIIFILPVVVFLFILYQILWAPNTMIFRKWRPDIIISDKSSPYRMVMQDYINEIDIEDIIRSQ